MTDTERQHDRDGIISTGSLGKIAPSLAYKVALIPKVSMWEHADFEEEG
jgi:hypothetical protein